MIDVKHWRRPLILGIPLVVGGALALGGVVRLVFEGEARLAFSGSASQVDRDLALFRSEDTQKRLTTVLPHPIVPLRYDRVPGHPQEIAIRAEAPWPKEVVELLTAAAAVSAQQAFARQKAELRQEIGARRKELGGLQAGLDQLAVEKRALMAGSKRRPAPAQQAGVSEKIQALKTRRQFLIDHYPTHTDIQTLAQQIKDLQNEWTSRPASRSGLSSRKISELARRSNEAGVRFHYFSRCVDDLSRAEKALKPAWTMGRPVQKPERPARVEGWPLSLGIVVSVFILACVVFRKSAAPQSEEAPQGLWRPNADAERLTPEAPEKPEEREEPAAPVELQVVPVEPALPADPLTAQAAALYDKWTQVAKALYTPAPEAPQGVLDQVGPLLQESSEFLPQGHDALARYLAQTVTPGDLPAHVARTVLMTLTGAQDAGVTPEHRLAMTLAALFHDLAMVPRPAAMQDDVGSEVGRLSASVLKRIPGLGPAILSMVEDILIGMDEFKLATWQNAAMEKTLEPLSKVLREIDRFEKVMQKQRARLNRHIARKSA